MATKLHTVGSSETNLKHYSCVSAQTHFAISTPGKWGGGGVRDIWNVKFPNLRGPSDICSDDYGHIHVSGQYSHNIHRLTEDGKIIDIPLSSKHGIQYPVAMCFNRNYTKLYIVFDIYFTEFGGGLTTVLPVLFKYCYKYCYSDSRNL